MMEQNWIEWCQKQFSEVARALSVQGYDPALIDRLNVENPNFATAFNLFQDQTSLIMDQMAMNPGGFHHYEAFNLAKRAFLTFTNQYRENLTTPALCA